MFKTMNHIARRRSNTCFQALGGTALALFLLASSAAQPIGYGPRLSTCGLAVGGASQRSVNARDRQQSWVAWFGFFELRIDRNVSHNRAEWLVRILLLDRGCADDDSRGAVAEQ